jgi:hypothetical protein
MHLRCRFTNLPVVIPRLFRWLAGWAVGTAGVLAEPALLTLQKWYTTGYDTVQGSAEQVAAQHPQVASKVEAVRNAVVSGVEGAKARVTGIVSE